MRGLHVTTAQLTCCPYIIFYFILIFILVSLIFIKFELAPRTLAMLAMYMRNPEH